MNCRGDIALVDISLDECGGIGGIASGSSSVQSLAGETVGLGSLEEDSLSSGDIGIFALPRL